MGEQMSRISCVDLRMLGAWLSSANSLLFWPSLLVAIIALEGCGTTTQGPVRIVTSEGAVGSTVTGWTTKFVEAETASQATPEDTTKAALMLNRGFSLVKANCSSFFDSAGNTQRWIIFARDTVAAVGTLATAVMALHHAGGNAVANVAFATGATVTGLDLYTRNFLFAAENIDSVRDLVLRALDVHSAAVLQIGSMPYGSVLTALMDNQNICAPTHINALAKEAIKKGNVVVMDGAGDGPASITRLQDERVLKDLGVVLNLPGAVSTSQAGALWWLLRANSDQAERETKIAAGLVGLPADKEPFMRPVGATPTLKPFWPQQSEIEGLLERFSDSTKERFKSTIAAERLAATARPVPAIAPNGVRPVAAPLTFSLGQAPQTSGHVSIGIRGTR